ncbi:MAG TPA: hypothetical protein VK992_04505 [Candidatus Caenarcaniphilales bacterium]|nr:hypothetical protein [Candidatus Caenarcaniphilales bacterium]
MAEYRATPGNVGASALWRELDGEAEFLTLNFWESEEAIRRFAGQNIEPASSTPTTIAS